VAAQTHTVAVFHPTHGLSLSIAAGSGRSWIDEPDGDPRHAHLHVEVPVQAVSHPCEDTRIRSHAGFVRWDDLARFADRLDELAARAQGVVDLVGTAGFELVIRLREDDVVQAETAFSIGHHNDIDIRCRTGDPADRDDLARLAQRVRAAVGALRPPG
jgi:hypothetical protein